jgi:branched-chain amino acid transport system substrate-binding protein
MKSAATLLLAAVFTVACQTTGGSGASSANHIVIASDLPASGFGGEAAVAQQAIAFAIRQQGSIAGFKLDYWPLDDSLGAVESEARGPENVEQMIAERQVLGMVGPWNSDVAFYEIPVANPAGLAMVSPSTTNPCLTVDLSLCRGFPQRSLPNNFFRIAAPDPLQGRGMARFAANRLHVARVAVFNEWGPVGNLIIDEFAAELARTGGKVVHREDIEAGTSDFTIFLRAAKAQNADAVYAVGDAPDRACVARAEMSKLLPGAAFLSTDGVTRDPQCVDDAVDTTGMFSTFVDVTPMDNGDPNVAAYLKAYPKASDVTIYTFAAYDCARILIAAIAAAIAANHGIFPTRAQVLDEVANTNDFKGVTGTYSFDANGDATSPLMAIWTVQNGRWVYLQQISADKPS